MDDQNHEQEINDHLNIIGLLNRNIDERYERVNTSDEEVTWSSCSSDDDDHLFSFSHFNITSTYNFRRYYMEKRTFKRRNLLNIVPQPRSGHKMVATDANLYVIGGFNPRTANAARRDRRRLVFQDLWSYNDATNSWRLIISDDCEPLIPRELTASALALCGNVLLSFGGTCFPFGESCSNECVLYTTGNNAAAIPLLVSGELPTAVYGMAIAIQDSYLYTIGGTTGYDFHCHVYRLDLVSLIWKAIYISRPAMQNDPIGRYGHEIVNDGNHLFVFGGATARQLCIGFNCLPAFNLKTHCWEYFNTYPDLSPISCLYEITGYPKPRKCFGCAQFAASNGDIEAVISGGSQADSRTFFSDVWKINMRTKKWTLLRTARLPSPLHFHSAACSEAGAMYIFGGVSCGIWAMKRRNDIYKMWINIPKLSEMCWEAILYYNENLEQFDRNMLRKEGIPEHFIKRLPSRIEFQPDTEEKPSQT